MTMNSIKYSKHQKSIVHENQLTLQNWKKMPVHAQHGVLTYIETRIKWLSILKQQFETHFLNENVCILIQISSLGSSCQ